MSGFRCASRSVALGFAVVRSGLVVGVGCAVGGLLVRWRSMTVLIGVGMAVFTLLRLI